jgi:hypothetical protein
MTDIVENMASSIAEAMNGGEFKDGKWYSEGHREAWRKAVAPYAIEIYRLRQNLQLAKACIESSGKYKFEIIDVGINYEL